jgi:hypothetical protein
MQLNKEMDIS